MYALFGGLFNPAFYVLLHPLLTLWTRTLLAQQLQQEGYTERVMSDSSISNALQRAGIQWQRAKQWLRSPDPNYAGRKKDGTG